MISLASRPLAPHRHLDSTQDLLGRFGLISAYDTNVRPYVRPVKGTVDKGKGKESDHLEEPLDTSHRIPHGLKSYLSDLPGIT